MFSLHNKIAFVTGAEFLSLDAADESAMVTGSALIIDSGWSAGK